MVTYPLLSMGPGLVSAAWGVFVFKEISELGTGAHPLFVCGGGGGGLSVCFGV